MSVLPHFRVNVQITTKETKTLNTLCNETTRIIRIKQYIKSELNLNNNTNEFELKYNNSVMEEYNTLSDYCITDSKHLIYLCFCYKER